MINRSDGQVTDSRAEAARLPGLAREIRPHAPDAADRILWVRQMVDGALSMGAGGGIDPLALVDPASVGDAVRGGRKPPSRFSALLESLPLGLGFLPLLITSVSLGLFVRVYAAASHRYPDKSPLTLWASGAHGMVPVTFGTMLILNACVAGLILLLVLTGQVRSSITQASREAVARDLERRLRHALAGASIVLAEQTRAGSQLLIVRLEEVVGALLEEVRAERQRLRELAAQVHNDLSALVDFATAYKQGAATLLDAAGRIEQLYTGMVESLNLHTAALQSIDLHLDQQAVHLSTMTEQLTEATSQLALTVAGLLNVSQELTSVSGSLTRSQQALVGAVGALQGATEQLHATAVRLDEHGEAMGDLLRRGRADLARLLARAVGTASSIEELVRVLQKALPSFQVAAADLRFSTPHFRDLPAFGQGLVIATEAQREGTEQLAETVRTLTTVARALEAQLAVDEVAARQPGKRKVS